MTALRIIDLQRRLREIGRIRTGDLEVSNGRSRPRKLERFRLTSADRRVIDAAAIAFDGTPVKEWAAPSGKQWETYLGVDELAVVVPPGDMSFSQSYETWSAGGCKVRCDGQWDHIADQACHCDPTDRACAIHTRLSVMVPDLPGIGVWRLETHSYYAAVELGGLVDLCSSYAAANQMIPARLRLEQRSVKRIDPKGKVVTRRFAVPVLDLDVHPLQLGGGGAVVGEIGPSRPSELPALNAAPAITPVPEPERYLRPSVAAQVGAVNEDRPRESRQAAVPRTGLKPRTAEQAVDKERAAEDRWAGVIAGNEEPPDPTTTEEAHVTPDEVRNAAGQHPPDVVTPRKIATKSEAVFSAHYVTGPKGGKFNTSLIDRMRHALVWAQTHGEHTSTTELDATELLRIWQRLEDIDEGRLTYDLEADSGVTWITASGKRVTVTWAELEPEHEDGAA